MFLKKYLESQKGQSRMRDRIIDEYLDYADKDSEIYSHMKDVYSYGLINGTVSSMIFYNDTVKFYDNYQDEINSLLYTTIDETGMSIQELFGNKFDKEDPLCLETHNKNLLSWFGYEETTYRLMEAIEEKLQNGNIEIEEPDYEAEHG